MVVIYTACKSSAEIAKLLNSTKKYDLEGWQTKKCISPCVFNGFANVIYLWIGNHI